MTETKKLYMPSVSSILSHSTNGPLTDAARKGRKRLSRRGVDYNMYCCCCSEASAALSQATSLSIALD